MLGSGKMAKQKSTQAADGHAVSFLGFARQYQQAGNLVYESDKTLSTPIYFMYAHAIELGLKAFLRANNVPIVADKRRKHHRISALYEECRRLGLRIGPDDFFDISNIVEMLEEANEEQGLRYFRMKGSCFPELSWVHDTLEKLLQAVEPAVQKRRADDGLIPGRAVKADMIMGKFVPDVRP
jgi:hypothetical protein